MSSIVKTRGFSSSGVTDVEARFNSSIKDAIIKIGRILDVPNTSVYRCWGIRGHMGSDIELSGNCQSQSVTSAKPVARELLTVGSW
jgi:hypothetical protein